MVDKAKRRDYDVRIQYVPAPGTHVRQMSICNALSVEDAQAKAVTDFKADNPGATVLGAEARHR